MIHKEYSSISGLKRASYDITIKSDHVTVRYKSVIFAATILIDYLLYEVFRVDSCLMF